MSRVRSIVQPDQSQDGIATPALIWIAALFAMAALALVPASRADAQSVRAGVGRASLHVAASTSVPVRLDAEQAGAPVVVASDADFIMVDLPVRVAANLTWTLQVRAAQDAGSLQVLDARGAWVPFTAAHPVAVLDRRAATNPKTFNVHVRMPVGASADQLEGMHLLLTPAGT